MMKKIAIIFSALLVLLIAFVLLAPGFIDWNQYRERIADTAQSALGRSVSIDGNISFRVLPSPRLMAAGVSIANTESAESETFASLESLDLEVSFFPLLGGNLEVERVVLSGAIVSLEQFEDGSNNWTFTTDTQEEAADSGFELNTVEVTNGRITYYNHGVNKRYAVSGLDLLFQTNSMSGPFSASGNLIFRGTPVVFDAALGRLNGRERTTVRAALHVAGESPGLTIAGTIIPDMEALEIAARIRGGGNNTGQTLAGWLAMLDGAADLTSFNLAKPYEVDANFILSASLASLNPVTLRIGEARAQGVVEVEMNDAPDIRVGLDIPNLDADSFLLQSGEPASFDMPDLAFLENITGTFDVNVDAMTLKSGLVRQMNIEASLQEGVLSVSNAHALLPGPTDVTLQADILSGDVTANGRLQIASSNLRSLMEWTGQDLSNVPEGQLTSLTYASGFELTRERLSLSAVNGQVDVTEFSGSLSFPLKEDALEADLVFNRLNLDQYWQAEQDGVLTRQDIEDVLLQSLTTLYQKPLNIEFQVDQLTFRETRFTDTQLIMTVNGQRIDVTSFQIGSVEGVSFNASGQVRGADRDASLNLSFSARAEDMGNFVRHFELDWPRDGSRLENLDFTGSITGFVRQPVLNVRLGLSRMELGVQGDIADWATDNPVPDLTFTLTHPNHLDLAARFDLPVTLAGAARPVDMRGTLRGGEQSMIGAMEGSVLGGNIRINANIENPLESPVYDLTVEIDNPSLTGLVRSLGQDFNPDRDAGRIVAGVQFAGNSQEWQVSGLDVRLGRNGANGVFSGNLTGRQGDILTVRGGLSATLLDLGFFMDTDGSGADQVANGGTRWSNDPFVLDWMEGLDADLTVSAEEMRYDAYRLNNLQARLLIKDNALRVRDIRGRLYGGTVSGELTLTASSPPQLSGNYVMEGVDIASLSGVFASIRPVTGTLNMSGRFQSVGNSQQEMISNLDGTSNGRAVDGALRGVNLPQLASALASAQRIPDFLRVVSSSVGRGETAYSEILGQFTIEDGVVTTDTFSGLLNQGRLSGQGRLDLGAWQISGSGNFTMPEHENAPPFGVIVNGDVNSPAIRFDTEALQAFVAQRLATSIFDSILGGINRNNQQNEETPPEEPPF